jgi:acetone carboxylase gamma subunit
VSQHQQVLGEYLAIEEDAYVCRRCGHRFCSASEQWKLSAGFRESPCDERSIGAPIVARPDGQMVFRQYYCPGCATQVDCEVARKGEPLRWNFRRFGVEE